MCNSHVIEYYKAKTLKWCVKRNAAEFGSVIEGYEALAVQAAQAWSDEITAANTRRIIK